MAEPEEILLDGAHHATRFVQRLWRHRVRHEEPQLLYLVDCRARLEIFVRAAFGISVTVGATDSPNPPSLLRRSALRIPREMITSEPIAETDGLYVRLPASVANQTARGSGCDFYRLCAAQLAARLQRGTPSWLSVNAL